MVIDTHCHLFKDYYNDLDEVIKRMGNNIIIVSGTSNETNIEVIELCNKYKNVYGTLGIHPTEIDKYKESDLLFIGKNKVSERFIRTIEKQTSNDLLCFEDKYEEYNYVVVAKNHRPFKSKGVYGYSHGGFTPQEIIIPKFIFTKTKETVKGLDVKIGNKSELSSVTGEIFAIKIETSKTQNDLFSASRKVQILIFANGIQCSESNIFSLTSGSTQTVEFSFSGKDAVLAILLDADSREQLDSVEIKKSNIRDLGGLL